MMSWLPVATMPSTCQVSTTSTASGRTRNMRGCASGSAAALWAVLVYGEADRLALHPIDTWLGGIHLHPGGPLWRWDGARDRLVTALA